MIRHELIALGWSVKKLTEDNNFAVMQYIGIKDKNGKEIYEGDIVHSVSNTPDGPIDVIGKVFYRDEKPEFMVETFADHKRWHMFAYFTTTEVLGNIYENPELIK